MRLLAFGFCVLQGSQLESTIEFNLRASLYEAALGWFAIPAGCVRRFVTSNPLTEHYLYADGRTEATASSSPSTLKPSRNCKQRSNPTRPPMAALHRAALLVLFPVRFNFTQTWSVAVDDCSTRSSLGVVGGGASQGPYIPPPHPARE